MSLKSHDSSSLTVCDSIECYKNLQRRMVDKQGTLSTAHMLWTLSPPRVGWDANCAVSLLKFIIIIFLYSSPTGPREAKAGSLYHMTSVVEKRVLIDACERHLGFVGNLLGHLLLPAGYQ